MVLAAYAGTRLCVLWLNDIEIRDNMVNISQHRLIASLIFKTPWKTKGVSGFPGSHGASANAQQITKTIFGRAHLSSFFILHEPRNAAFSNTFKNIVFVAGFRGEDFSSRGTTRDLEIVPGLILGVLERSWWCKSHLNSHLKRCQQSKAYKDVS